MPDPASASAPATAAPILELRGIAMSFAPAGSEGAPVLAGVDLAIADGEVLGLVGRSGSGKSTLLRIAAGLIRPSAGKVSYLGRPLDAPAEGIAVVFQTFALYPWLTVLENVELGLDALRLPRAEVRARALEAIATIGLDGFQSAYPRELSGGMRQRVGFARAIVSEPTLLLMDEPFSALDVLTAEALRTDLLDLLAARKLATRAVLLVTHNIEEAVQLCDRILVLGGHPAHGVAELGVPLPQPRNRLDLAFQEIAESLYGVLTQRALESVSPPVPGETARHGLSQRLPAVSSHGIENLIETLAAAPASGAASLGELAARHLARLETYLPYATALHLLAFGELEDGHLRLTAAGQIFADSGAAARRALFREHLLRFVHLAGHIAHVLDEREDHRAPRERFALELQDHLTPDDTERTLRIVIDWGRYASLFGYDDVSRTFTRPAP